jgi:threonine aldolase
VQSEIPLHLDGARIFNAIVEKKQSPKSYGQIFDSISICLSKGLGAPVGSLLIGNEQFINRARRVRKVFGGGMRQAGIIAAGGIYALENNIDRLVDDHKRAKTIANAAKKCSWIENVIPVETNIIVCYMKQDKSNIAFIDKLEKDGIKCIPFGEGRVRMVTHLDVSDVDVNQVCEKLNF